MCANFQTIQPAHAAQLNMLPPSFDYATDIYPMHTAPLIFKNKRLPHSPWEWREAMFGMVPKWAKEPKIARHTYNSRSESVAHKPSFKHAWHKQQLCLVPAQKIYEPRYTHHTATRYAIERADNALFTMAALYEITQIDQQIIRSFTLLTINADQHSMMRQFHRSEDEKRSIVIIPAAQRDRWLSATTTQAIAMLQHFDAHDYMCYPEPKIKNTIASSQASLF